MIHCMNKALSSAANLCETTAEDSRVYNSFDPDVDCPACRKIMMDTVLDELGRRADTIRCALVEWHARAASACADAEQAVVCINNVTEYISQIRAST